MITKLAAANQSFTITPKRSQSIDDFKGKLHFKNLSSEARAKYRVQDANTNEVPVKGELENYPPNHEKGETVRPGFTKLVVYNDSDEASLEVTPTPDPGA